MSHRVPAAGFGLTSRTIRAVLTINRIPETVGYNVAYFALGASLALNAVSLVDLHERLLPLGVAFTAIMLSKMQASVADAIHDRHLDERNPEKAYIATAIDRIGSDHAHTMLVGELIAALYLWGWLSLYTGRLQYLVVGVIITFVGFVYSYPPRLKERGVLNHFATSVVDVVCVLLPVTILAGTPRHLHAWLALAAIFLYTFAYHVMHQAGDTYYDREYGVSTFTQSFGVPASVLLAATLTVIAGAMAIFLSYILGGGIIIAVGLGYGFLFLEVQKMTEKEQSNLVSKWFDIASVAAFLNGGFAVSILL